MADPAKEVDDLRPDGFQSAESSPTNPAAAAAVTASKQLQASSLSGQSTLIRAAELAQSETGPPVQLIPATPRTPASPQPTLAQGCTYASPNLNDPTASLSQLADCSHKARDQRDDYKHQTLVSPDLNVGLVHTEPIERRLMSSSPGDDEMPRAKRLWESGRRSLAKIIASVASSNQSQIARMSSYSNLALME